MWCVIARLDMLGEGQRHEPQIRLSSGNQRFDGARVQPSGIGSQLNFLPQVLRAKRLFEQLFGPLSWLRSPARIDRQHTDAHRLLLQ